MTHRVMGVNGEAPACQPPTRSPSPHRVRMAVVDVQMRAAGGHLHGGVCWMRARGRGMTWWARTAQKSGSRLLPNAAVGVWLRKVFKKRAMAPGENLAPEAPCVLGRAIDPPLMTDCAGRHLLVTTGSVRRLA